MSPVAPSEAAAAVDAVDPGFLRSAMSAVELGLRTYLRLEAAAGYGEHPRLWQAMSGTWKVSIDGV